MCEAVYPDRFSKGCLTLFGKCLHQLLLRTIWLSFAKIAKTKQGHYQLLKIYQEAKTYGQKPFDMLESPITNPHVKRAFNRLVTNIGEQWEREQKKEEVEFKIALARMSARLPPIR